MIQLDNEWRIRPDSRQWTLEKFSGRKDTEGEEVWIPKGYYVILSQALQSYVDKSLKGCRTVDGLLKKLNALEKELEETYPDRLTKPVQPEDPEPADDEDFLD